MLRQDVLVDMHSAQLHMLLQMLLVWRKSSPCRELSRHA